MQVFSDTVCIGGNAPSTVGVCVIIAWVVGSLAILSASVGFYASYKLRPERASESSETRRGRQWGGNDRRFYENNYEFSESDHDKQADFQNNQYV